MTLGSFATQVFLEPSWTARQLPGLAGKVAIVTGATSGIGAEIVAGLAAKGAHVFCIARDPTKAQTLIQKTPGNIEYLIADFTDLDSVVACASKFASKKLSLDILVNNAGVYSSRFKLSKQGFEEQFAVNFFGLVVFTNALLPIIAATMHSRIVNVSSFLHVRADEFDLDMVQTESEFSKTLQYCRTKLAVMQYTAYLQDVLDKKGKEVYVNACHPGLVATNMTNVPFKGPKTFAQQLYNFLKISPVKGAITPLYIAGDADIQRLSYKAKYFVPYAALAEPSRIAYNLPAAKNTMAMTRKLLQSKFKKDFKLALE